ncbi:hypothetical protein [Capnocytophaga cynodegmi]|uniref:Peptidase MA-like domain-containing protein n=1 Tax=Capnocytophaga cynodegmi TaxID=28189 RepID=A0A0B7HLZ5_9FLAO|nr:hypothetical protein [Capnocytophaga cynodegmi]CEN38260.1 exported hypothetical protein [Capnocytophaga cynodegmi]CEN38548.1 exported hypothetical protein [Capnocytophaga cynodegmi]
MLKYLKIILLIPFPVFCFAQKQYNYENIQLNSAYLFYEDKREEQEIILSLIDAYFSKNLSYQDKTTFWKYNGEEIDIRGGDLYFIEEKANIGSYTPTILSMLYIDGKYQIRVAWMGNTPEDNKVLSTYNFLVNKDYQFENIFENQIKTFTKRKIRNLTFYYKNPKLFRKEDVKKALKFNKQMAEFFELPEIGFSCFIFDNYLEQKNLRGFDFDTDMRIGEAYGGLVSTDQKEIFSGNGTAYYPHEMVHLYTAEKVENKNHLVDEGIATYFGGARGLNFSELTQIFYSFLQKENVDIYTMLNKGEFTVINTKVDSYYAFSALLCHTILEHHGKEKLFELLDSGNDREEFLCKIEETFNIQPSEFHSFFMKELAKYVQCNK